MICFFLQTHVGSRSLYYNICLLEINKVEINKSSIYSNAIEICQICCSLKFMFLTCIGKKKTYIPKLLTVMSFAELSLYSIYAGWSDVSHSWGCYFYDVLKVLLSFTIYYISLLLPIL